MFKIPGEEILMEKKMKDLFVKNFFLKQYIMTNIIFLLRASDNMTVIILKKIILKMYNFTSV